MRTGLWSIFGLPLPEAPASPAVAPMVWRVARRPGESGRSTEWSIASLRIMNSLQLNSIRRSRPPWLEVISTFGKKRLSAAPRHARSPTAHTTFAMRGGEYAEAAHPTEIVLERIGVCLCADCYAFVIYCGQWRFGRLSSDSAMASTNRRTRAGSWWLAANTAQTGAGSLRHSGRTWIRRPARRFRSTSTHEFIARPQPASAQSSATSPLLLRRREAHRTSTDFPVGPTSRQCVPTPR